MAHEPEATPEPEKSTGFLLQSAHRKLRAGHMEALKPFGLTIAHLSILGLILAKGLSQKHLQDLLGIDKSVMVHLIDDLEKRGLAERHSLPDDRRTNIVFLTPSGAEAVAVLGAAAKRVEDDFLSPLTKEQRDLLNQLLQTVTAQSGGDL